MANLATKRVGKDLAEFYRQRNDMIFLFPNEEDILKGYALIVGPEKTPYEKGLFLFQYTVPTSYPTQPPRVTFLTTGRSTKVRFNPNLYACGKVCLSILGTWQGPPWVAANTLETVFISIQSLMTEYPYYNEPGYERRKGNTKIDAAAESYNERISYYTLLHAVIEQATTESQYPTPEIRDLVSHLFFKFEPYYRERINAKMSDKTVDQKLTKSMDPFGHSTPQKVGSFSYPDLLKKLDEVKKGLLEKHPDGNVSIFDYQEICNKFAPHLASNGQPNATSRPDLITDIAMLQPDTDIMSEWFGEADFYESEDGDDGDADESVEEVGESSTSSPSVPSTDSSDIQILSQPQAPQVAPKAVRSGEVITIEDSDEEDAPPPSKKKSPVKV